jgi:hypothetical protein
MCRFHEGFYFSLLLPCLRPCGGYPPCFSYVWEIKDLRSSSVHQGETKGLAGKKRQKGESWSENAAQNGKVRGCERSFADDSRVMVARNEY